MRVAIIENTAVTHHGQVGVALHEAAAVIDLYKPWLDGRLPNPGSFDALISFGGEQTALSDHSHPYLPDLATSHSGGIPRCSRRRERWPGGWQPVGGDPARPVRRLDGGRT